MAAVAGCVLGALPASAQQSDFAGAWVLDAARSESASPAQPAVRVAMVISQSPTVLSIERRDGEASRTVRYKLDGSETTSTMGSDSATGHMRREGGKLVTETVYSIHGYPLTQTQVHSLSSDGRELTVESTVKVEHGYQGQSSDRLTGAPNYSKGVDVFVRQARP